MGVQTQSRVVDGHTYQVSQMLARKAERLFHVLVRIAAPEMGRLLAGPEIKRLLAASMRGEDVGDPQAVVLKVDFASLGEIVGGIATRADDATWDRIRNDVLASAEVDGQLLLPMYDTHFMGRLDVSYQVIAFALEVNFGDFFGRVLIAALGAAARMAASSTSTSTTTSSTSGPSGDSSSSA